MRRRQDDFDEMGYGSQPEKVLFLQLTSARCRLPAQALRCARWRAREMAGPSLVERWHNCRDGGELCRQRIQATAGRAGYGKTGRR